MNPMKERLPHTIEEDTAVDVILRDGSTLRLCPPALDDADALVRFFAELSDQSLYLRFHGHPSVDAHLVAADLAPDWAERGALIGAVAADGGERVVALASYVRLREREAAEVAFTVDDGYQGRGIGTRLLEQLAARAAEQGIARFVAEVIADNRPMLRVFSEAGFSVSRMLTGGVVEVTFPIAATADYAGALPRATTPRLPPRGRSSSRRRWRCSAPRRGAGRSAASSSATSSPATSAVPPTRSTAAARPWAVYGATSRSARSLSRSTWPSSAFPRPPCSRRPSRRCARECAR